jgi:hypothetical protein
MKSTWNSTCLPSAANWSSVQERKRQVTELTGRPRTKRKRNGIDVGNAHQTFAPLFLRL